MEIHALIVGDSSNPKIIPISNRYSIALQPNKRLLYVDESIAPAKNFESRVKSFNALYGENGSGKTEILLQIAATFVKSKKPERVGVLFSEAGVLCLYRGQPLSRWSWPESSPIEKSTRAAPRASAIFYSTSPFENARRAAFSGTPVQDVSPPFGRDLYLDGLSLLDSFQHFQEKAAFLQKLRISVRAKLPSTDAMIDRVMMLFKGDPFPGHQLKTVRLQLRTWVAELFQPIAERTLLSLLVITSIPSSVHRSAELSRYFADRIVHLIDKVADQSDYEAAAPLFAELCKKFIEDFPEYFPFNGQQIWEYLRAPGRLLQNDRRAELFGTPAEINELLQIEDRGPSGIARYLTKLGLLTFKVKNLSSGETAFLMLYASLSSALSAIEKDDSTKPVFLLLDEGEMFLHPSWQRKYLTNLLDFISKYSSVAHRTHVLISTHSLIVAADAPPNTLFDVQAGEMRNGFGLGPAAVLSDVYHVNRFAGDKAASLIDQLIDYLKNPTAPSSLSIKDLAEALADKELQEYVLRELGRRAGVVQ